MDRRVVGLVVSLFVLSAACGPAKQTDNRPKAWAGSTPHFIAFGKIDGEVIDFRIEGADAADTAKLYCSREYEVPLVGGQRDYSKGRLGEVKVDTSAIFPKDAANRYVEIEYKKHHTQGDAAGAVVKVVPRSDTVKTLADEMWFEWEWHAEDKTTLWEQAAQSGTFTLGEYTGTPDSTGLIIPANTGTFGGLLNVRWSETDEVTISVTANCIKSSVVEVQ